MKRLAVFLNCIAILLATSAAGAVTLGNAVRTGDQLQFTVTGESNAIYVVETSTNLQQWQAVSTNRQVTVTRTASITISGANRYCRARVARTLTAALIARSTISLQGNNIQIDSYDSANPIHSTPDGQYDPLKARDGGDVVVNSALTNSVSVGNANIFGAVTVAPGGGAIVGPSGCVGSIPYVMNPLNAGTIEPGWLREEAGASLPDVILPSIAPVVPGAGNVGGTNYTYVLGNGTYRLNTLIMSGSAKMMVTGNATLHVVGNLALAGSALIIVAPNASLVLYVGGDSSFGGGGIANQTGRALGFQCYGLNSNASVTLASNLTGTIYAPRAHVSLVAGGLNAFDFSGAVVAASVAVTGNFRFHYDEDLARSGPVF